MKTSILIPFIFILLLFNACSRQAEKNYSDFSTVKEICFDEQNITALLGMPMDMLIMNDLIVVLDAQTDSFFHFFSKDRFNYLGGAIRRGNGPNEETLIYPYFKKYEDDKIFYKSVDDLKIVQIKITDDKPNVLFIDKYDLPKSSLNDVDFFLLNDKIFSSASQRPASKDYFVLSPETGKTSEWGELIALSYKNVNPDLIPMINQKLTTVNAKDNLIASVFNLFPILKIYSLGSESLIVEQQMSDASNNQQIMLKSSNFINSNELINYYHRIKSTHDYIYALYGGFSVSAYFKEGEMPHVFDFSREIHIWKWDGTPVMKLKLDRPVFSFDVTPDNKKIIATSVVDVDKLFEAEIPWD